MAPRAQLSDGARRKLIEFDAETWHALHLLSRDSLKSLQELADEAFTDLLKKHRPARHAQAGAAERACAGSPPTIRARGRRRSASQFGGPVAGAVVLALQHGQSA